MKSKTTVVLLLAIMSTMLVASSTALHGGAVLVNFGKVSQSVDPSHINGTVTNAVTTSPIKDANVTANGVSDLTDDNGHYELDIAPGNYTVMVAKSGFASQSKNATVAVNQTATVNFALASPGMGWLVGNVTDSKTSMPIENAVVMVGNKSADTNSAGRYEIELAPGTYNVTASKNGYVSQTMMGVVIREGSMTTVNFALVRVAPVISVRVTPRALNLRSNGRWITVTIELPEGFNAKDINISSIRLNNTTLVAMNAPIEITGGNRTSELIVKFSREAVEALIMNQTGQQSKFGEVKLTITGEFKDHTAFSGSDMIKTILNTPMSRSKMRELRA